ncbi:hypothetical protein AWC18_20335 [Mycolicibacter nonchromogenicus]|uniref:DUF998 domain-containing protein n=1 Tax=Mycolicibacter nonchromogenicus TaxID=1782 RepID=A0A1X1YUY0_MYCNO|nr:hypothetical protein [Mycolicibacter nonchromogenicus]OMC09085.1 hypothetical protein A5735_19360 [Mycolicibacter heraklionensis]ORW14853.1 hypothetical protein AWC18_20335 [Mycolicibacter nonchromogenicus]
MTPVCIGATAVMVTYCLWVRRDTWWSRWEAGATFAIAMEGLGLLLLTPWAATELSPPLHTVTGVWNVQQLLGFLCLVAGIIGNIYHMLVRLTDPAHVWPIMRKHLLVPVGIGVAVVVVAFVSTDRGFEPDLFAALDGDHWVTVTEVAIAALVLFLSSYVGRLVLSLRHDQRARTTLVLYVAAMTFAAMAGVAAVVSIWFGGYAGTVIWVGLCLSVSIFAYGLARSWKAKRAWFTADGDESVIDAQ